MAHKLYQVLRDLENETVNNLTIKFCRMLVPKPQDVGTDDNGVFEMVIEFDIYYERQDTK